MSAADSSFPRSAYLVVGSILWCVMQSISELGTLVRRDRLFVLLRGAR